MDDYLKLGLIYRNNDSAWACAPLIVPKPGPDQYRFTLDLRPVNAQTVPTVWPMPNVDATLLALAQEKCFADLDFSHCFWQLPEHEHSQEILSFVSPDGVFSPTRVPQGQINAAAFCQSTFQNFFSEFRYRIVQWLDDCLLHTPDPQTLLNTLRQFSVSVESTM